MALILWAELLLPQMWLYSSLPAAESDSKLEHTSFFLRLPVIYIFNSLTHGCVFQMAVSIF